MTRVTIGDELYQSESVKRRLHRVSYILVDDSLSSKSIAVWML